jgi:hypothetical protein
MLHHASKSFEPSDIPEGFVAATGALASSISDSIPQTPTNTHVVLPLSTVSIDGNEERDVREDEVEAGAGDVNQLLTRPRSANSAVSTTTVAHNECEAFANGYHFPPRRRWQESLRLGSIAFIKYSITPLGFAVVLYGLLVVAFGGMLFLLLCNAAPAMCSPTCNDINSPRRIWIEIDAQVLNALFCITGFGLAPWRFRDLNYLLRYRLRGDMKGLRRLAGIHRDWFRLPGSQMLPADTGPHNANELPYSAAEFQTALPDPVEKTPGAPLTGIRAPPTKPWKMDYVVWLYVALMICNVLPMIESSVSYITITSRLRNLRTLRTNFRCIIVFANLSKSAR